MDKSENNKRVAKNTILLYIRMLISTLVSLFTARLTLQLLGVEDYGINNVVAGMVTMFTFLNSTLATGTQRFITFALGERDIEKCKRTFLIVNLLIKSHLFVLSLSLINSLKRLRILNNLN